MFSKYWDNSKEFITVVIYWIAFQRRFCFNLSNIVYWSQVTDYLGP